MKKNKKELGRKIFTIVMFSIAGLFVLAILFIISFYFVDKHRFNTKYKQAISRCSSYPVAITYIMDDGDIPEYSIFRTGPDYGYNFLTFDSLYGYACSNQEAVSLLKSETSAQDDQIQIYK